MGMLLNYTEAAKRVKRSVRNVRRWAAEGMPMVEIDGMMYVDEPVLLKWWRERMAASPAHYYRMRRERRDLGLPDPTPPESVTKNRGRSHARADLTVTTAPAALSITPDAWDAPNPDGDDEPEQVRRYVEPVIELPPLRAPDEYDELAEAMRRVTAACRGLEVFTQDHHDAELQRMMAGVCADCPLLLLCRKFARAEQPTSGFWAGQPWKAWAAESRVA